MIVSDDNAVAGKAAEFKIARLTGDQFASLLESGDASTFRQHELWRGSRQASSRKTCQHWAVIEDSEIVEAFAVVGSARSGSVPESDYELRDFRWTTGEVDVEVAQRSGLSARLKLGLPSAQVTQPWLYAIPRDAVDWVHQLFVWIDEEVFTDGLGASRTRDSTSGESYVLVEPYGWQHSKQESHNRLGLLAGPLGWHGDVRPE
ncbi:hypothetical protein [Subtercola endophyticus]|uniref:hypothetical protein n=1 Tax=Subtercola endophyticus TaxID=2895559 RepID=UPI001E34004B|nr:hypothetical protein [Subtercola endophyticus]UFS59787.1 hypothetical protein LQ955_03055 [Subtercola endophyticus]